MKHLLIILSFLLLSSPVIGQETGVLFLSLENGELVYYEEGDNDNDGKYVGEIDNGKPNGQGTFTFPTGRKGIGEFRDDNPWNITDYDKNGNIIGKFVNGEQIEQ